jgi:hypothetical protein
MTLTFRWNSPGATGVLMSSMDAMRIVVLVSPTSVPGAGVPDRGVAGAVPAPEDGDDEQPAVSAMTASALAAMAKCLVRQRPARLLPAREPSLLFRITMLRPYN